MGRAKIPPAGPRHPARKLLGEKSAKEVAKVLRISPASVYQMKRNLNQAQADRIAEAFGGPEPAEKKPKPKEKKSGAFVTGDHPAWDIIEKHTVGEIADKCGLGLDTIEGIAEKGLRPKLAEAIVAAFPDLSEERMKEALRETMLQNDGAIPQLRCSGEPVPEVPEPRPVKSWVDPGVKKKLTLSMDLVKQLLEVKGAFLVVPLEGITHD